MPQPENMTENPARAREIPPSGMSAPDLLSHVLAQIRLSGDHVYVVSLPAGQGLDLPPDAATICVVTEGALRLGEERIGQGDLVLMAHGVRAASNGAQPVAEAPTRIVVCRFHFDPDTLRALVAHLPGLIHIRHDEGAAWLENIAFFMLAETGDVQPGASLMIARLIDLIVIRTLRTWVQRQIPRGRDATGWLRGLADARIARVLQTIHDAPFDAWTVDDLAAIAGMSRSSFSARFADLVGVPPLRYQARWRLALARDMIRGGGRRVGEVALAIGYEAEAAFSRAYKAEFGQSPAADIVR